MSDQSLRDQGPMAAAAAPKVELSDRDSQVDLRAFPQGPQLAAPQQFTVHSVLSRLSKACQVRGFNPEWVPSSVHGRYRCAVKLGARLIASDETHETPEMAKTAIAREALAVVVNMPWQGRTNLYRPAVAASSPSGDCAGNDPPLSRVPDRAFLVGKITQLMGESSYTVRLYENAASGIRDAFFEGLTMGAQLGPMIARHRARRSARRGGRRRRPNRDATPSSEPPPGAAAASHYSPRSPRGILPASNLYPDRYDPDTGYYYRAPPSPAARPPSPLGHSSNTTTGQSRSRTAGGPGPDPRARSPVGAYASRSYTPRDYRDDEEDDDDDERRTYYRCVEGHRARDGRSRSPMRGYD